jgi:hypothetical protein
VKLAYVYLLEEVPHCAGESGPWTKIGFSQNDPEWRLSQNLKRGNPRHLRLAVMYEFDTPLDMRAAEKRAHIQFQSRAHQKEWFRVSWQEVAAWADSQGWRRWKSN